MDSLDKTEQEGAKQKRRPPFYQPPHEGSRIDHVVAIMSGKGGVGKSMVTGLTALAVRRRGKRTGILDADITGPSIPAAFHVQGPFVMRDGVALPVESRTGIPIVSTNLLLPNETDPVIWKGPMVGSAVKQFWSDFLWEDIEYLFVDMPPGTGDVPLTVYQTLPVEGILIVTSPQELVSMIVEKAINMARMMGVPVLGIIENMSYFRAPDTGKKYAVFGESHVDEVAEKHGLKVLAKLPLDPDVAAMVDRGQIEAVDTSPFDAVADAVLAIDRP